MSQGCQYVLFLRHPDFLFKTSLRLTTQKQIYITGSQKRESIGYLTKASNDEVVPHHNATLKSLFMLQCGDQVQH